MVHIPCLRRSRVAFYIGDLFEIDVGVAQDDVPKDALSSYVKLIEDLKGDTASERGK